MSDNVSYIFRDEHGMPVLFTAQKKEAPNENLPDLITPDSTSGPAEWGRYHDAVREASRSFDNPDVGDIHHFLNARARHPEKVDAPAFHEAVKRQRMADLVDMTDHHMRRDGSLPRGHRHVRVQAPKGYLRRALRQSSPEDVAHLRHRLGAIGHSSEHVDKYLSDRVAPDMWDQATSYQVTMADGEFDGLYFDDSGPVDDEEISLDSLSEALREIKPVINVYVNVPSEKESD